MKTIEEIEKIANKLYPDVSFKKDVESEDTFRTNEIRRIERLAFYEGYKYGHDDGYEDVYEDRSKRGKDEQYQHGYDKGFEIGYELGRGGENKK